ncbi:MAG: formate dehydrogenase subunit gamma [Actinomycetota bacterium]
MEVHNNGRAGATQTWDAARARAIINGLKELPGASLPILHALQEEFGYVHADAIPLIADALILSQAEVVGILNFYHDFRQEPPGRRILKVCRAESCQSMGCEALVRHLQQRLGIEMGETTPEGDLTLTTVYCLGNCALSPAVMLDQELYGRVSPERADRILEAARSSR